MKNHCVEKPVIFGGQNGKFRCNWEENHFTSFSGTMFMIWMKEGDGCLTKNCEVDFYYNYFP